MGAALAIPIGMGLMAYSAAGQYSATKASGQIQAMEGEAAAKQEELAATQREGDRKARLAEAMASQIATSGASGIASFEGSPLTILNADIAAEEQATQRDVFQTRLRAKSLRARGKMAEKFSKQQAKLGLIGSVGQMGITTYKGLK